MIKKIILKSIKKVIHTSNQISFKIRTLIPPNEYFIVSPYGIGDTFIICSLLNEFQKVNNVYKIRLGLIKESHLEVIKLFQFKNIHPVKFREKDLIYCKKNILKAGIPIVLHPSHFLRNALHSLIGYKGLTLIDIYKILLNLPINTQPCINLHISSEITKNAQKRFFNYGLVPQKTIILAPHAHSVNEKKISLEFWKNIIEWIKINNYKIAAITNDPEFLKMGVDSIYFPLSESIPFLNLCHAFISIRNGLCDLVGTADCKKIILYPKLEWYSGPLIEGASLKKMNLSKEPIFETEISSNEDAKKIISILKNS